MRLRIVAFSFPLGHPWLPREERPEGPRTPIRGEFLDVNETARQFSARPFPAWRGVCLAAAVAFACAPAPSRGQAVAPSRVTPTTLAPSSGPSGAITLTGPAGLTAPANAANLSVLVGN